MIDILYVLIIILEVIIVVFIIVIIIVVTVIYDNNPKKEKQKYIKTKKIGKNTFLDEKFNFFCFFSILFSEFII